MDKRLSCHLAWGTMPTLLWRLRKPDVLPLSLKENVKHRAGEILFWEGRSPNINELPFYKHWGKVCWRGQASYLFFEQVYSSYVFLKGALLLLEELMPSLGCLFVLEELIPSSKRLWWSSGSCLIYGRSQRRLGQANTLLALTSGIFLSLGLI